MRRLSPRVVLTADVRRQVAMFGSKTPVINLPRQPKSIAETLTGLPELSPPVPGIFAAVPDCVDLIDGPYQETDEALCKAFRPKSAIRPKPVT